MMLTLGSLFSGIGGFELGLERAGMRCIWQSEIDPYACAVLRKHWPDIPNHGDIRNIRAGTVERPDVICGGFPCQDISNAGKRAGIDGERSGLWGEFARVIGEIRPDYVIVENVAALLGRGIERVLGDLAALGFDAEWHCIPAAAVGAPHLRERVWIIANADRDGLETDTNENVLCNALYNSWANGHFGTVGRAKQWSSARPVGARLMGVGNGISTDVDRLRCLGNAIVPQVAEVIGRAIMRAA